jgi:uncharacterized protein (DUF4415 family)
MMQKEGGLMNTIKEGEFDYQTYTREHSPDVSRIQRGTETRKQRFEIAKKKSKVRIDGDILEQFRQLDPHEPDCEKLINQALREWLAAEDMKELVREELQQMVRIAFSSVQDAKQVTAMK